MCFGRADLLSYRHGHTQLSASVEHRLSSLGIFLHPPCRTERRCRGGTRLQRIIPTIISNRCDSVPLWDLQSSPGHQHLVSLPKHTATRASARWELLNAGSARRHKDTIREHLIDHNIDVMLLTETWLQENEVTTFKDLTPLGYKLVTAARPQAKRKAGKQNKSKGGGLAIIHKTEYTVRKTRGGIQYKSFELLDVTIVTPYRPIRVVVTYRPPGPVSTEVLADFSSLFDDLSEVSGPLVVAGDFNVHVDSSESPGTTAFLQMVDEYGLTQHVSSATHKKGHTIDLFITKNHAELSPEVSVVNSLISDHYSIVASLRTGRLPRKTRIPVTSRNIKGIVSMRGHPCHTEIDIYGREEWSGVRG